MEVVLAGLQWSECLVYLDDVIVFSSSFEEHISRLEAVFKRLRKSHLKLNPGKCDFFQVRSEVSRTRSFEERSAHRTRTSRGCSEVSSS